MMMRRSTYLWIAVAMGLATLPVCGRASVHGKCSNCHTMHNSQNNQPMNYNGAYTTVANPGGSTTPNPALLRGNCLACHTGDNNGGTSQDGTVPFVYTISSGGPTYTTYDSAGNVTGGNTLAGGNFYWCVNGGGGGIGDVVAGGGHNVDMLGAPASPFTTAPLPPGFQVSAALPNGGTGPASWPSGQQLTCAGVYGCHGDRTVSGNLAAISGAHHNDATGEIDATTTGATTVGGSYRFLLGIYGNEDSDWEFKPTDTSHNQYHGYDRSSETDYTDKHTISYLCAECHGNFHNGSGNISSSTWGSPWIRHPTDYDMGNTPSGSEYRSYGANGTVDQYNVIVPVASQDVSSVVSSVTFNDDTIVMCLSCHRAHGSPYASLLRWNYRAWPGNGGFNGCNVCHSSKN